MPVIVISGSRSDDDLARAYENQVAAYVLKPGSRDEYFNAMRALKEFFFHVSTQTQPTPTTTMTARNWPARVTPGSDSLKRWHIKLRSAARAEAIVFQLEDGRGAAWRRGLPASTSPRILSSGPK
jgi:DNA-binding NarL/FixJ family response regulator